MLHVSPQSYYALQDRPSSPRALVDVVLTERSRTILAAPEGNDGSPDAGAGPRDKDYRLGRKRFARFLRKAGIRGAGRCFSCVVTPDAIQSSGRGISSTANSLPIDRIHFGAADMINLPTSSRFNYLAMEGDARTVLTA